MDTILSALAYFLKIDPEPIKKAIQGWGDNTVKTLDNATSYLENEIKSTLNYMIQEFKNSIFWKILSAMGEIAKAILADLLDIVIKNLFYVSITAPHALRPKFAKMARSLEEFRDPSLFGIKDFNKIINKKAKNINDVLDHAKRLRDHTKPITSEESRNNAVNEINNIAEKKPVFIIPWFDYLNGVENDEAIQSIRTTTNPSSDLWLG